MKGSVEDIDWAKVDSWVWEIYTGNAVYGYEEGEWPEYAVTFNPDVRLSVPKLHEDRKELDVLCAELGEDGWVIHVHHIDAAVGGVKWSPWWATVNPLLDERFHFGSAYEPTREQALVAALYDATGADDI